MAKRYRSNGFTLPEMLVVLLIVSICAGIGIKALPKTRTLRYAGMLTGSEIMRVQAESMLYGEENEIIFGMDDINGIPLNGDVFAEDILINGKGNVDMAQTIELDNGYNDRSIIVWLGCGRVVFDEEEGLFND